MSELNFDTWKDRSGTNEFYKCRAWVNFNGTGTVAIRASGNVDSITDNGTGNYTVNFTNAMPDVDYSASMSLSDAGVNTTLTTVTTRGTSSYLAGSLQIDTATTSVGASDTEVINVAIFR